MVAAVSALSIGEARRIALAAGGFGTLRDKAGRGGTKVDGVGKKGVGRAALLATIRRLGLLQIDSVNVLVRAQYVPLFSRLGVYDPKLLDALAYGRHRKLFEYWGHEASLLPLETLPLLRWRMERARQRIGIWRSVAGISVERPQLVAKVEATIRECGPMAASDFEHAGATASWWGWSDVKRALEFLFRCGTLTTATRRRSFERVYDLTERVLPDALAGAPPKEKDAQRELLRIAARAYGVATESDLRDYFRLEVAASRAGVAALVAEGALLPVTVQGWKQAAYIDASYRRPRRVRASALLSPFDPLVWNRARARRLFEFDYRLEIYTPSHKRVHGYYVLPYLVDEALMARIDAKADRADGVLRIHAVHYEEGVDRAAVFERLRGDVDVLAAWLGLGQIRLPEPRYRASAVVRRSTSSRVE